MATTYILASFKKIRCIHVYTYDKNIGKGSTKASETHEKVGNFFKIQRESLSTDEYVKTLEKIPPHVSSHQDIPSEGLPNIPPQKISL